MTVELKWWGRAPDAQEYAVGPCVSQEEARAAAVAERLGLQENGWLHFELFEAAAQPFWLADWIGALFALECANDDLLENGPAVLPSRSGVFSASREQKTDLALRLHAAAEAWQIDEGLRFSAPLLDAFRLVKVAVAPSAPELRGAPRSRQLKAIYDYTDEQGRTLYQVLRCEPKEFCERRPMPDGSWAWGLRAGRYGRAAGAENWKRLRDYERAAEVREMPDAEMVPYRLPQIRAAIDEDRTIWIVEGEKDVEALEALGLTATCNARGTGWWRPDYAAHFIGAEVVVIPDADQPGRTHADKVCASLLPVAARVRLLDLGKDGGFALPERGDVSDWLAMGGTRDALEVLAEAFSVAPLRPRASGGRRMTDALKNDALVLWSDSRGHDGRPVSLEEFARREVESWATDADGDPVPPHERAKAAILTASAAAQTKSVRVAVTRRDGQPVARILDEGEPIGEALMRLKEEAP